MHRVEPAKTQFARSLRTHSTDAERRLWKHLKMQRHGHRFRRQHVLGPYIVDFVCLKQKLIIELDGGQHAENVPYDAMRTKWLRQEGYRVLRFWNHDIMQNTVGVLAILLEALTPHPPKVQP